KVDVLTFFRSPCTPSFQAPVASRHRCGNGHLRIIPIYNGRETTEKDGSWNRRRERIACRGPELDCKACKAGWGERRGQGIRARPEHRSKTCSSGYRGSESSVLGEGLEAT